MQLLHFFWFMYEYWSLVSLHDIDSDLNLNQYHLYKNFCTEEKLYLGFLYVTKAICVLPTPDNGEFG